MAGHSNKIASCSVWTLMNPRFPYEDQMLWSNFSQLVWSVFWLNRITDWPLSLVSTELGYQVMQLIRFLNYQCVIFSDRREFLPPNNSFYCHCTFNRPPSNSSFWNNTNVFIHCNHLFKMGRARFGLKLCSYCFRVWSLIFVREQCWAGQEVTQRNTKILWYIF